MKIEVSPNHERIREEARRFGEQLIAPVAQEYDKTETFPGEIVAKAADKGFAGWQINPEFGGPDHSLNAAVTIYEEFFAIDPGIAWAIVGAGFGSESIQRFGSSEQKERYLPPVAAGDAISAVAISEPEVGSDASAIETTAWRDDDEWVINGEKKWVTHGSVADHLVVLCRTDQNSKGRYNGFSQIIVEDTDPGVEQMSIRNKACIRSNDMSNLKFDGARIPAHRLVGEPDMGFLQQLQFYNMTRTTIAAQAVGIARGAADLALKHAQNHEQFGRPIVEFQSVEHELAEMYMHIEASRLLTYRAATAVENDEEQAVKLASMAKAFASQIAADVTEKSLTLHGARSFIRNQDIERLHRDVRITQIYEGPSKVQKTIIGKELL